MEAVPFAGKRREARRILKASMDVGQEPGVSCREAFNSLKSKLKEIDAMEGVGNLLTWDQEVFLPSKGAEARGYQAAAVARVLHSQKTDPEIGELLEVLAKFGDLQEHGFSASEAAAVREAARDYQQAIRMPASLESRSAILRSRGVEAWKSSRKQGQFSIFAPVLQKWVDIMKEEAAAVAPPGMDPYDYCLDKYERGLTREKLDKLFAAIKGPLVSLIRQVSEKASRPDRAFLQSNDLFNGRFSLETQRRLSRRFLEEIGFDWESGRLDEGAHPMTVFIASPVDVRLTTRYSETDLAPAIRSTLHEGGHGLYEQGRDLVAAREGLPVSRAAGMGVHESQSLLWERMVGMSEEFWEHYWPAVLRSFSSLPSSEPYQFYRVINEVHPGLIRVEADELSYPLHVLLRYEIEKGLLDGTLSVEDVPKVWCQKMEEYLGITPRDDAEGCLQDIHWGAGLFGYFPTYTIGAVYAAQLFEAAEKSIPELRKNMRDGKFLPLREWLRTNIHSVGSLYPTADELIAKVTGKPLDPACFLRYLSQKYSALYDLTVPKTPELACT